VLNHSCALPPVTLSLWQTRLGTGKNHPREGAALTWYQRSRRVYPGGAAESLLHLGLRDHAPADARGRWSSAIRPSWSAFPHWWRWRLPGAGGAGCLERPRLLRRAGMLHKARSLSPTIARQSALTAAELRCCPASASNGGGCGQHRHGEPVARRRWQRRTRPLRIRAGGRQPLGGGYAVPPPLGGVGCKLVDPLRPGDFNQAMMELGATLCLPRNPQCLVCPISDDCKLKASTRLPRARGCKAARSPCALGARRRASPAGPSRVLLEQRPASLSVMPGRWSCLAAGNCRPRGAVRMTCATPSCR